MIHPKYHIVTVLDVEKLLPFVKLETKNIQEEIIEEQRVKKELQNFIDILKKHTKEKIHYIGEEKEYGKHLERFLFDKHGFLEVIVEEPLTMKAHFIDKNRAEKFCNGMKKVIEVTLPESEVKKLFIDSIKVEKVEEEPITSDKWEIMHNITIHKTYVYFFVTVILIIIFEVMQEASEIISGKFFKIHTTILTIINAVIVAFLFEPIKDKIDFLVGRYISKR